MTFIPHIDRSRLVAWCALLLWAMTGTLAMAAPAHLAPNQIDAYVAPLSDSEVRSALITELQQRAGQPQAVQRDMVSGFIQRLHRASERLAERSVATATALAGWRSDASRALRNLTEAHGSAAIARALGILAIMIGAGLVVERLAGRALRRARQQLNQVKPIRLRTRLGILLIRILIDLIFITIFTVAALATSFLFYNRYAPLREFVSTYLVLIALLRVAHVVLRFVLSPNAAGLRLVALSDASAAYLQHTLIAATAIAGFGFMSAGLLAILGVAQATVDLIWIVSGLVLVLFICHLLWHFRQPITDTLSRSSRLTESESVRAIRGALARSFYRVGIVYVLIAWLMWAINVLLQQPGQAKAAAISALILLLVPMADQLVHRALTSICFKNYDLDTAWVEQAMVYVANIQVMIRFLLALLALLALAEAWGFRVAVTLARSDNGVIGHAVFNVALTAMLSYVVWQILLITIHRHLPEQDEAHAATHFDAEASASAPTSRAATLAPLIRNFLFVVLLVVVTMVALSSIGFSIAPLIAGAGVVGIAIGFGAQKLVQDVVSGIFFLVDDAFRVGEYVEAADMRGTVESISVRSMRLRHHLGPIQTIPYSEIKAVKNHSRDFAIIKLAFRVPFDTDIEKVRKVIKKVGQEMLKDEELGPSFLSPLKSQGVRSMEDDALLMRMKFTAVPGQQWTIRREAYRRVKEALNAAGIQFANRQVTVHVPAVVTAAGPEAVAAVAAAAAAAAPPADGKDKAPDDTP